MRCKSRYFLAIVRIAAPSAPETHLPPHTARPGFKIPGNKYRPYLSFVKIVNPIEYPSLFSFYTYNQYLHFSRNLFIIWRMNTKSNSTYIRLEREAPIEVEIIDAQSGQSVHRHIGWIHAFHTETGNVRRAEASIEMMIKHKDRDAEPFRIPIPPVRRYLDQYSMQLAYIPTGDILSVDGRQKIRITPLFEKA